MISALLIKYTIEEYFNYFIVSYNFQNIATSTFFQLLFSIQKMKDLVIIFIY